MKQLIAEHDWLTVTRLPACARQLDPVEGICLVRRALAETGPDLTPIPATTSALERQ
jgi:hypothetical protein